MKSITTETIESGPLFITCRVTYQFEGGGRYVATVKAIADYEYVEFSEEMTGLEKRRHLCRERLDELQPDPPHGGRQPVRRHPAA